jgi:hypothetical protein
MTSQHLQVIDHWSAGVAAARLVACTISRLWRIEQACIASISMRSDNAVVGSKFDAEKRRYLPHGAAVLDVLDGRHQDELISASWFLLL